VSDAFSMHAGEASSCVRSANAAVSRKHGKAGPRQQPKGRADLQDPFKEVSLAP